MRRAINIRSVWDTIKKCPDCRHVYKLDPRPRPGRPHTEQRCGWGECPICGEEVKLDTHQRYIQRLPEDEDDDPKLLGMIPNSKESKSKIYDAAFETWY